MEEYLNCPKCGSNENLKSEDSGYSSFNVATTECSCGYVYKTTCSVYPNLVTIWNNHVMRCEKIKKLSKGELQDLALNMLAKRESELISMLDKYPDSKKCENCNGFGREYVSLGFHRELVTCKVCNGKGVV